MKTSTCIAKRIKKEVDTVFGVTGGNIINVVDSFTKEGLEDFVDGIASQTLQGVGLINKDDIKKSEREDDDPFMVDEDEIEEDRDGDDDDRLYEDADEDEEYYDDDDD